MVVMNYLFTAIIFIALTFIFNYFIPIYSMTRIEKIKERESNYRVFDFIISLIVFLGIAFFLGYSYQHFILEGSYFTELIKKEVFSLVIVFLFILNSLAFYRQLVYLYSYFSIIREDLIKYGLAIASLGGTIIANYLFVVFKLDELQITKAFISGDNLSKFLLRSNLIIYALVIAVAIFQRFFRTKYQDDDLDDDYHDYKESYEEEKPAKYLKVEDELLEEGEIDSNYYY